MILEENLKGKENQKWQEFYRASTAAGVWIIAFMGALALATLSKEIGVLVGILLVATLAMTAVLGIITIGTMLEAQDCSRRRATADAIFAEKQRQRGVME